MSQDTKKAIERNFRTKGTAMNKGNFSLNAMGYLEARCDIRPLTSPKERLLKRLTTEFQHQRRTSFEKERMIKNLMVDQGL